MQLNVASLAGSLVYHTADEILSEIDSRPALIQRVCTRTQRFGVLSPPGPTYCCSPTFWLTDERAQGREDRVKTGGSDLETGASSQERSISKWFTRRVDLTGIGETPVAHGLACCKLVRIAENNKRRLHTNVCVCVS